VKFCKIRLFKFPHSAIRIPQRTPSLSWLFLVQVPGCKSW